MRRHRTIWSIIGMAGLLLALLVGCAPAPPPTPTPAPAKPAAPAPAAPTAAPKPGPAGTPPAPTTAPAKPAATTAPAKPAATAAPAKPAATKDTWVVAQAQEPDSLDPYGTGAFASENMMHYIFDPLADIEGSTTFKPNGFLAERWENPNPTTWRFYLRKGITFHNGDPFDAEDVKYTFDTYLDPNAKDRAYASAVKEVKIIDPYTVDLITEKPFAGFLGNVGRINIMPRKARAANVQGFATKPIGTGPYKLTNWVRGQRIELEVNEKWYRGASTPKKLVFRFIADPTTRVAELKTGGVDIIDTVTLPQVKDVSQGDTEIAKVKQARILVHPFNTSQKPFNDVKVRQALNYAVDKETIIKQVLEDNGTPLAGVFTTGWLGYDPKVKPYAYDPNKAKQLLADAGYPNGFEVDWSITTGVFLRDREIAEVVANQLGKIGVKVRLVPTERAKLQADFIPGKWEGITSIQWGSAYEPDPMLSWVFMRETNTAAVDYPELKKLVLAARGEVDLAKREKMMQELYSLSHDLAPWLFIHAQDDLLGKRKNIPWKPYHIAGSKGWQWFFSPAKPVE